MANGAFQQTIILFYVARSNRIDTPRATPHRAFRRRVRQVGTSGKGGESFPHAGAKDMADPAPASRLPRLGAPSIRRFQFLLQPHPFFFGLVELFRHGGQVVVQAE